MGNFSIGEKNRKIQKADFGSGEHFQDKLHFTSLKGLDSHQLLISHQQEKHADAGREMILLMSEYC